MWILGWPERLINRIPTFSLKSGNVDTSEHSKKVGRRGESGKGKNVGDFFW